MVRRMSWAIAAVIVLTVSPDAFAQYECADVCNTPEGYCTSTSCRDGILGTDCLAYNTNYHSNPGACYEPPSAPIQVLYPNDGINWYTSPQGWRVDDCPGNCGAGCSDNVNPCGGPLQYWELSYVSGPNYGPFSIFYCSDGERLKETYMGHTALGRWTYYGHVAPGCISHDSVCPEWTFFGCILFFGCGSPEWSDTWSYDVGLSSVDYLISQEYLGTCSGPG
jgi:hypothetical protein